VGGEEEVLGFAFDKDEAALLEERREWDEAGGADLLAGPAGQLGFTLGGHGSFSSGVG